MRRLMTKLRLKLSRSLAEPCQHERRICQRVRVVPGPVFEVTDIQVAVLAQCQQVGSVKLTRWLDVKRH
jgi:hypothetical protein